MGDERQVRVHQRRPGALDLALRIELDDGHLEHFVRAPETGRLRVYVRVTLHPNTISDNADTSGPGKAKGARLAVRRAPLLPSGGGPSQPHGETEVKVLSVFQQNQSHATREGA